MFQGDNKKVNNLLRLQNIFICLLLYEAKFKNYYQNNEITLHIRLL